MSVCSATTAATSRPRARGSSTGRLSLGDVHFMNDRAGARTHHPRKYSQVSTTKKSSSSTCCTISIVMTVTLLVAMATFYVPPMG